MELKKVSIKYRNLKTERERETKSHSIVNITAKMSKLMSRLSLRVTGAPSARVSGKLTEGTCQSWSELAGVSATNSR